MGAKLGGGTYNNKTNLKKRKVNSEGGRASYGAPPPVTPCHRTQQPWAGPRGTLFDRATVKVQRRSTSKGSRVIEVR